MVLTPLSDISLARALLDILTNSKNKGGLQSFITPMGVEGSNPYGDSYEVH